MTEKERLNAALEYATKKHFGQKRKGGDDYITHPIAVAEMLKNQGYGADYLITALFHDLLEDTDADETEIVRLGGENVLTAVKLLTKVKGYKMDEYISGILSNPIAKAVKTADRLHNLRSAVCCDENFKRKYIEESEKWFLSFSPEIAKAVQDLKETL